jgi:hypothetical protein
MKKTTVVGLALIGLGLMVLFANAQQRGGGGAGNLPVQESTLFAGSGVCARCHELIFEGDTDVSPVTLWRSTMMANSAKDPLWRAKVSAEAAEFPDLAGAIEKKCIKCHAPILYKEFDPNYGIADLENDPLARDGDSCTVCHQVQPDNFGTEDSFSGGFHIYPERTIFGPYPDPFVTAMLNNAAYTPALAYPPPENDRSINDAEHCATCHNLFTQYVDKHGNLTGNFPEQTPYYEWQNSDYNPGKTCQGCHMPQTETELRISTAAQGMTETRTPFWYHYFAGGNLFMPAMLQNNIDLLGVTAAADHFGTTIANATDLLENRTLNLAATGRIANGVLEVDVSLENLAGHKLPTGIPLRRVWIHLTVFKGRQIVFESGEWNAAGEILDLTAEYEPHHDIIEVEDQVQIYEGVMIDDFDAVTRLLLRAKDFIKDNRLPPKGFTSAIPDYEYVAIKGNAATDADFNTGGSGSDTVHYRIPLGAPGGNYTVAIEVCYQTVTPGEVAHLSSYLTDESRFFDDLYATADKAPVILKSLSVAIP